MASEGIESGQKDGRRDVALRATLREWPWGWFILAGAVWFASTFFRFGDQGRWLDDYAVTYRSPVTGEFAWSQVLLPPGGWNCAIGRMLHLWWLYSVQTLTWNTPWVNHLLSAIGHGGVAIAFAMLARALGAARWAAGCGAIVFLSAPIAYEAPLWPSTAGTLFGTLTFLLIARHIAARWWNTDSEAIAQAQIHPARRALHRWWAWVVLALASASVPMWYEQPTAALAAVPLLALLSGVAGGGSGGGGTKRSGWITRRSLGRGVLVAIVCGVPAAMVLIKATMERGGGARGGAGSINSLQEIGSHAALIARMSWAQFTMRDFLPGAIRTGLETLRDFPVRAGVTGALMLFGSAAVVRWNLRSTPKIPMRAQGSESPERSCVRTQVRAQFFLVTAFVCCFLPVLLVRDQWMASRLCYLPLGIIIMMVVIAASPVGNRSRAVRMFCLLVSIGLATTGSVAMVGIQTLFAKRFRADERQSAELGALVSGLRAHSTLIPIDLQDRVSKSGSPRFDLAAWGVWELSWSVAYRGKFIFARSDVYGVSGSRWTNKVVAGAGPEGVVLPSGLVYTTAFGKPGAPQVVPWEKVVPFRVDSRGHVVPVRRVVVRGKGDAAPVFEVTLPWTSAYADDANVAPWVVTPTGETVK